MKLWFFFLVVFVCLFIFIDNNGNAPNKLPTINIKLTFQLNILLRPYTFNNIWQNYDWFANYINQFFFQNSFKRYHTFKPKRLSAMVKWNVNCPPVVHLRDVNERVSYIRLLKLFTTMAFEIVYKKKTRKKSEYVIFVWIKLLFLFDRIYWTRDLQNRMNRICHFYLFALCLSTCRNALIYSKFQLSSLEEWREQLNTWTETRTGTLFSAAQIYEWTGKALLDLNFGFSTKSIDIRCSSWMKSLTIQTKWNSEMTKNPKGKLLSDFNELQHVVQNT